METSQLFSGGCPQCDGEVRLLDYDHWQGWRYRCIECGAVSEESEIDAHVERAERAASIERKSQ